MFDVLHELSEAELQQLSASLKQGTLAQGISEKSMMEIAGSRSRRLQNCLEYLVEAGMSMGQAALFIEAIRQGIKHRPSPSYLMDLVLSGPLVEEIPTGDTAANLHTMAIQARSEILIVGYAVYDGHKVFQTLAERFDAQPNLRAVFCLDIQRRQNDDRQPLEIVSSFKQRFTLKEWPGIRMPEVYYDPRSLDPGPKRTSLHAKCMVIDQEVAFVTSANFTEAAQERNIELGLLVRSPHIAQKIHQYFHHLIGKNILERVL